MTAAPAPARGGSSTTTSGAESSSLTAPRTVGASTRPRRTCAQRQGARFVAASATACRSPSRPMTSPPGPTAFASTVVSAPAPANSSSTVSPAAGATAASNAPEKHVQRGRVHLPEPGGRHAEIDPVITRAAHPAGHPRRPGDHLDLVRGPTAPGCAAAAAVRHGGEGAVVAAHHLDAGQPRPAPGQRRGVADARHPEQASRDVLDVVRTVPVQAGAPGGVDRVGDPGAPAEQAARQLLDPVEELGDVETADARELLADDRRLQLTLRIAGRVLPVTTAAPARAGVLARSGDPLRCGGDDLDRVGAAERPAAVVCDERADPLAGQRVAHEDHPARLAVARDAAAAGGDCTHVELEKPAEQRAGLPHRGGVLSHSGPARCRVRRCRCRRRTRRAPPSDRNRGAGAPPSRAGAAACGTPSRSKRAARGRW